MTRRITAAIIAGFSIPAVLVGGDVASAPPAQAASEAIFNDYEADGSNYTFSVTMTYGTVRSVAPDKSSYGDAAYFTLASWLCASVSYNYGPRRLRGPGKHYFADGAIIHVDPHRC